MNTPQDFEIYEFYEPSLLDNLWVRCGIGILIVLLITGIVYLILKRRRRPLTPGQTALQTLKLLASKDFSNKKEVKKAYFAITSAIKQYLHKQFNLRTIDKTDDELIALLTAEKFHEPTQEAFKKIHHNALWVKFANYDLIKTQVEIDLAEAQNLIEALEKLILQQTKRS